jgi:hypothetical protein
MLSLSSFSQTDTTKVLLPTKTARLIVKDLIKFDGCIQELTDDLQKELRKSRTKTFLYKVGTFVGIATSLFLFIK